MNNNDSLSLLFDVAEPREGEAQLNAASLAKVGGEVTRVLGSLMGPSPARVIADVGKCLAGVLQTRLRDIAIGAWNTRQEIAKYADASKYPPEAQYRVALVEHPVEWTYRPYVEISIGKLTKKIELTVVVKLNFKDTALVIQGGKYKALAPGDVSAEGSLSFGDVTLVDSLKSKPLRLPVSIPLGDGIPIGTNPLARDGGGPVRDQRNASL